MGDQTGYTDSKYFEFDAKTGTILSFRSNDATAPSVVVIPPTIAGVKVTAIGDSAFYRYDKATEIVSVVIPDSVQYIGKQAFLANTKLSTVTMPASLTELGESAFQDCSSLNEIEIKGTLHTIPESAFKNCDSLETVTLTGYETLIGQSAFENCRLLMNLHNTSNIVTIDVDAFKGSRIKKSQFDNTKVDIAENAFGK